MLSRLIVFLLVMAGMVMIWQGLSKSATHTSEVKALEKRVGQLLSTAITKVTGLTRTLNDNLDAQVPPPAVHGFVDELNQAVNLADSKQLLRLSERSDLNATEVGLLVQAMALSGDSRAFAKARIRAKNVLQKGSFPEVLEMVPNLRFFTELRSGHLGGLSGICRFDGYEFEHLRNRFNRERRQLGVDIQLDKFCRKRI